MRTLTNCWRVYGTFRASEKNFYQKIKDIYTTAADYDEQAEDHPRLFRDGAEQTALGHPWAHGCRSNRGAGDADKPNMGLTTWSGNKVRKHDFTSAKNYLTKEEELGLLNLIVTQYLDFAEFQARTRKVMYMRDWVKKLDDFLRVNDRANSARIRENLRAIGEGKSRPAVRQV